MSNEMTADALYFEQYKILVNSYEALQTRRASINNFLIFMYSSIVGLYNFMDHKISSSKASISIYCLAICVSITWISVILKCMQTEKVKYNMVKNAESHFPMKIFTNLKSNDYLFNSKILSTTVFELLIPIVLLVVFVFNLVSTIMAS